MEWMHVGRLLPVPFCDGPPRTGRVRWYGDTKPPNHHRRSGTGGTGIASCSTQLDELQHYYWCDWFPVLMGVVDVVSVDFCRPVPFCYGRPRTGCVPVVWRHETTIVVVTAGHHHKLLISSVTHLILGATGSRCRWMPRTVVARLLPVFLFLCRPW